MSTDFPRPGRSSFSSQVNPSRTAKNASEPAEGIEFSLPLPSGPYPLRVQLSAVRDLGSFAKNAKAGACGLLLGRASADGAVLEGAVPTHLHIPAEWKGPRYAQSGIGEFPAGAASGSPATPIGFFRVQAGGWRSLTQQDCDPAEGFAGRLARNEAIFLLIRTFRQRPPVAAVFALDEKPVSSPMPLLEFPLDEYLLRDGCAAPPLSTAEAVAEAPKPRRRGLRRGLPLFAAAVAAGAALSALAGMAIRHWNGSPGETNAKMMRRADGLGLRIVREGKNIDLTWDRKSAAILDSTAGTLVIRDGESRRVVPLSGEQLREGHVVYAAASGADLDFRVELKTADGTLRAESVQMIGAAATGSVAASAGPNPGGHNIPAPSGGQSALPMENSTERPTASAPATTAPLSARTAKTARPRHSEAFASREEPSPGRATVPSVTTGNRRDYAGPKPVHQVNPILTPGAVEEVGSARKPITVAVRLRIDNNGNVRNAETISSLRHLKGRGVHLRVAAAAAARDWRFQPATRNGEPVPSETTITFTFGN